MHQEIDEEEKKDHEEVPLEINREVNERVRALDQNTETSLVNSGLGAFFGMNVDSQSYAEERVHPNNEASLQIVSNNSPGGSPQTGLINTHITFSNAIAANNVDAVEESIGQFTNFPNEISTQLLSNTINSGTRLNPDDDMNDLD